MTKRYAHFETLHRQLSAAHPDVTFPAFPESKFFDKINGEVIRAHVDVFNPFLEMIASSPTLSVSPFLLSFLEIAEKLGVKVDEPAGDNTLMRVHPYFLSSFLAFDSSPIFLSLCATEDVICCLWYA